MLLTWRGGSNEGKMNAKLNEMKRAAMYKGGAEGTCGVAVSSRERWPGKSRRVSSEFEFAGCTGIMLEVSGMSFGMGRKVGRERVIGNFGYPAAGTAGGGDGEIAEDEVWSIIDETAAFKEENKRKNGVAGGGSSGRNRRWPIASSNGHCQVGGLSLAFQDAVAGGGNPSTAAMIIQQFRQVEDGPAAAARHSAPVNVPDWSKILRDPSPGSPAEYEMCSAVEEDREWVPPHEYLARESARQRGSATSIFEGVGRTLKGRDMSRVRNAVWSQTGFFG